MDKIDLDAILATADGYKARKRAMESIGELKPAYLATLAEGEAIKAFEALRPLVARVRKLEREKDWLVHYYAKLDNTVPCPYLEGSFDQAKPCPFWGSESGELPDDDTVESWKQLLIAPVEYGDEYIDCGTSLNVCLRYAAEQADEEAGE